MDDTTLCGVWQRYKILEYQFKSRVVPGGQYEIPSDWRQAVRLVLYVTIGMWVAIVEYFDVCVTSRGVESIGRALLERISTVELSLSNDVGGILGTEKISVRYKKSL